MRSQTPARMLCGRLRFTVLHVDTTEELQEAVFSIPYSKDREIASIHMLKLQLRIHDFAAIHIHKAD